MAINNKEKMAPAIMSALCKEYFSSIIVDIDQGSYAALDFLPGWENIHERVISPILWRSMWKILLQEIHGKN